MAWQSDDIDVPITREQGSYQVYIHSLGNRQELVLPFLRQWIGGFETLAAIRNKVEQDIELVQPTLFGLAKHTADAVAQRLVGWGADAAAYHDQDKQRPQYDRNQFGVILLEVGHDRQAVNTAVREILDINSLDATILIDSAPKPILQNASIQDTIAAHERLTEAGAKCDLTSPEPVWMDTSTGHIPLNGGPFLVIIHQTGPQMLMVNKTIGSLLPQLSENERHALLNETPVILLSGVSLETAELVKLKLEHFGATIIIQETAERQNLGESIHPQNPTFGIGPYQIVLGGFQQFKKISVIQELRKLLPGVHLTELTALFKEMPVVVIDDVDQGSGSLIFKRLEAAGAIVTIQEKK